MEFFICIKKMPETQPKFTIQYFNEQPRPLEQHKIR